MNPKIVNTFIRGVIRTNGLLPPHCYLTFFGLSGIIVCIHGGCSSVVERQIVDLVVVGSNPITHPFTSMFSEQTFINQFVLSMTKNAPVAQLDRATDFESVGRTFEPCRAHVFSLPITIHRTNLLHTVVPSVQNPPVQAAR